MAVFTPRVVEDPVQQVNNNLSYYEIDRLRNLFLVENTRAPSATDDRTAGIDLLTLWHNRDTNRVYINVDNTVNAALWKEITVSAADAGDAIVSDKAVILDYQEVTAVPSSTTTTMVTLAPGSDTYVTQIECSGEEYGKFELYYNSAIKATKRAGPDRNVTFLFDTPLTVTSGDTLDVKITHFVSGETPTFECMVLGFT